MEVFIDEIKRNSINFWINYPKIIIMIDSNCN